MVKLRLVRRRCEHDGLEIPQGTWGRLEVALFSTEFDRPRRLREEFVYAELRSLEPLRWAA